MVRLGATGNHGAVRKIGKPLPPNKLEPYTPSVFGLDQAQRDCRFEMIRIVRKVDAVAENPQVAVDPTRNDQYLSPIISKKLIPFLEKVDPVAMREWIDELGKEVDELKAEASTRKTELEAAQKESKELSAKLKTA